MAVPGEDFDNLEYMYGQLLSQRDRMFFHVVRLVRALVSPDRLAALAAQDATKREGEDLWSHAEYLDELRALLFAELEAQRVSVDAWRRNVQRTFVDEASRLLADPEVQGEVRALLRAELAEVRGMTGGAPRRAGDTVTRAHMEFLRARVSEALDES